VLSRPIVVSERSYGLEVIKNERSFRSYRLGVKRSKRSSLADDSTVTLGIGQEVVFALDRRNHDVQLFAADDLVLRIQVAERTQKDVQDSLPGGWNLIARLASYYDANILRYSEKYIQSFENGDDPGRFRVQSLDDIVYRADLYVDYGFAGLKQRPAELSLDFEHRAYQKNSIKDWSRFGISFSQEFRKNRRLTLRLSTTSDYYVRHYRDSDLTGQGSTSDPFRAFGYKKTEGLLTFAHEVGASMNARYYVGLAQLDHFATYEEFDGRYIFVGLRHEYRAGSRWRLSYGLQYTDSEAQGYDQPGETRESSNDADPSYLQSSIMAAARLRLPGKRLHFLFAQVELGWRDYTTDKSPDQDRYHSGRDDKMARIFISWNLDLSERYRLTLFAQARQRRSEATASFDIGAEKDFDQYEVGIRLRARFGD
jgi:hypothetical protein